MTIGLPELLTLPAGLNAPHTQKSWRAPADRSWPNCAF